VRFYSIKEDLGLSVMDGIRKDFVDVSLDKVMVLDVMIVSYFNGVRCSCMWQYDYDHVRL